LAEPQEREALLVAPGVALGDRREVDVVLDADADTQDVLEVAAQVLARPAGELADERDVARAGRDGRLDADDGGRDARDRDAGRRARLVARGADVGGCRAVGARDDRRLAESAPERVHDARADAVRHDVESEPDEHVRAYGVLGGLGPARPLDGPGRLDEAALLEPCDDLRGGRPRDARAVADLRAR